MNVLKIWVLGVTRTSRSAKRVHPYWFLICGFNVAILTAIFSSVFGRLLGKRMGTVVAIAAIVLYTILVGADAAVVRAAVPRVLEQYRPRPVLWSGTQNNSSTARNMQEILINDDIPIVIPEAGQALDLGLGAVLEVLALTRRVAVLRVSWGDLQILLPIGVDFDALEADYGPANVLLLAESGFAPLNPPEWIARIDPDLLLLSVEAGNRDGLPSEELREVLESYPVLRTDRNGWVEIVTDGERNWISTGGN